MGPLLWRETKPPNGPLRTPRLMPSGGIDESFDFYRRKPSVRSGDNSRFCSPKSIVLEPDRIQHTADPYDAPIDPVDNRGLPAPRPTARSSGSVSGDTISVCVWSLFRSHQPYPLTNSRRSLCWLLTAPPIQR